MKTRRFKSGDEVALFGIFLSSIRNIASHDYTPEQIKAWASEDIELKKWAQLIRSLRPFIVEVDGNIAGYADVQSNGYIDHFLYQETMRNKVSESC